MADAIGEVPHGLIVCLGGHLARLDVQVPRTDVSIARRDRSIASRARRKVRREGHVVCPGVDVATRDLVVVRLDVEPCVFFSRSCGTRSTP